jgi:hypothetical protein
MKFVILQFSVSSRYVSLDMDQSKKKLALCKQNWFHRVRRKENIDTQSNFLATDSSKYDDLDNN